MNLPRVNDIQRQTMTPTTLTMNLRTTQTFEQTNLRKTTEHASQKMSLEPLMIKFNKVTKRTAMKCKEKSPSLVSIA